MWRKLIHLLALGLVLSGAGCFLDDDDDDDATDEAAVVEGEGEVDVTVEDDSALPLGAATAGAAAPAVPAVDRAR